MARTAARNRLLDASSFRVSFSSPRAPFCLRGRLVVDCPQKVIKLAASESSDAAFVAQESLFAST